MFNTQLRDFFIQSFVRGVSIYWTLFRITLPLLIIVRLLDEYLNLLTHSSRLLSPLMEIVGLPGDAAIVFATALFLQVYAGILVLATLWTQLDLTTAQVTILMTMMLVAHALPVETRIVQKAGVSPVYAVSLRLISAFVLGMLLHFIYADVYLQNKAVLFFVPEAVDNSWNGWLMQQLRNWTGIFFIVQALVLLINILRVTHAEKLLIWLLIPLLRHLGIGKKAVTMTMIGMLLGISYGGALLIEESRRDGMSRRDILCTLSLLCICHAVVEDTLLALLVGAHISGVLFARVLFALVFMVLLNLFLRRRTAVFQ